MENTSKKSLFQRTLDLLNKLMYVEGWKEAYYVPLKASKPDMNPKDLLWNLCRQGGTLCVVLNLFQRNIIDPPIYTLDMKDPSPFDNDLAKKNVYKFLSACSEALFYPDDMLFQLDDIYKDHISTFLKAISLIEDIIMRYFSAAGITVSDLPEEDELVQGTSPSDIESIASRRHSLQNIASGTKGKVIMEIVETETKYVEDLELLLKYKQSIESDRNTPLRDDIIRALFSNIEDLVEFQRKFLIELESILYQPSSDQTVGTLFAGSMEWDLNFTCYHVFCSNYPVATKIARDHMKELKTYSNIIPAGMVASYLIKPIQRICRYPLLLRELLKNSDPSDYDYEDIEAGWEIMKQVAGIVNEKHRKAENALLAEEFRSHVEDWKGLDFFLLGDLLLGEKCIVKTKDSEKELWVYLFEQYIVFCTFTLGLITRKKEEKLSIRSFIDTSVLLNVTNASKIPSGNESREKSFEVRCFWKGETVGYFSMIFKAEESFKKWMSTLSSVIEMNKKSGISHEKEGYESESDTSVNLEDLISSQRKASIRKVDKLLGIQSKGSKNTSIRVKKDIYDFDIDDLIGELDDSEEENMSNISSISLGEPKSSVVKSTFKTKVAGKAITKTSAKLVYKDNVFLIGLPQISEDFDIISHIREKALSKILAKSKRSPKLNYLLEIDQQDLQDKIQLYYKDAEENMIELLEASDIELAFEDWGKSSSITFIVDM